MRMGIKAPVISIIVPCYNVEECLSKCVESLLSQTIGQDNLEIILVDDRSTDGTREIIFSYAQNYDCIRTILNEKNLRQGGARNRGIEAAKGKYIGFADADDWLEPTAFAYMVERAERCQSDVAIMSSYQEKNDNEYPGRQEQEEESECREQLEIIRTSEDRGNMIADGHLRIGTWNCIFLREMLEKNQIRFPENLLYSEDIYWGCIVKLYCSRIFITDAKLYHYRIGADYKERMVRADWLDCHRIMNGQLWREYSKRHFGGECMQAVVFDYIMTYYLIAVKVLSLCYEEFPCAGFRNICADINTRIPEWESNPYLQTHTTEFQKALLLLMRQDLSDSEIQQMAAMTKTFYGG